MNFPKDLLSLFALVIVPLLVAVVVGMLIFHCFWR